MPQPELAITLIDPDLDAPSRAHPGDAGLDLLARTDATLSSLTGPVVVPTGIAVAIPDGYVGLVCSRSGLAARFGIAVLNAPGVIDPGYRGEVQVVLFSVRVASQTIHRGERIAQLLVQPAPALPASFVDQLPSSARGDRGLGSTGV